MFSKRIRDTSLTRGIADEFFGIQGDRYGDDVSFLSTLRALLYKRSNNGRVALAIASKSVWGYAGYDFTTTGSDIIRALSQQVSAKDALNIFTLDGTASDCEAALRLLDNPDNGFLKTLPDFHEAKDLEVFVRNRCKVESRFYVDENNKRTIVICYTLTINAYHLIQSLTPRLFPWFFTDAPLSDMERSLLDSLTYRSSLEYERILAELAELIDLREFSIKKIIGDFDKQGRRYELERVENEITNCRNEIRRLMERYNTCMSQLDTLSVRLAGQEIALSVASDSSELADYFIHNRNLTPTYAANRQLNFTVKTTFDMFDPEQYRQYINNVNSFLYKGYNFQDAFADIATRRRLLDAIFTDEPALRVNMCSNYCLDLRGTSSAIQFYAYDDEFNDYIPNPHIHHYACLGNYQTYINGSINAGNLIGAIEQCIASAKSMNLSEPHTIRYFLGDLFTSEHRVIRLPDGRNVTTVEALSYLDELEAKREEDTNV